MANNITLTGRLTATPELKTTSNGVSVCSFTLAVKRPYKRDETDFIPCQAWRQDAEFLTRFGAKGNMVAVTGSLTTRKWQDSNGNNRINYEVTCETVELIESRSNGEGNNNTTTPTNTAQRAENQPYSAPQYTELAEDEELPF